MKLLNFSLFKESVSEFYRELEYSEYCKEFCNLMKFTKEEYDVIYKAVNCDSLPKYFIDYKMLHTHMYLSNGSLCNICPTIVVRHGLNPDFNSNLRSFEIFKKADEYYIISEFNTSDEKFSNKKCDYYLCDQIDGVINFFKDKVISDIKESKFEYLLDIEDLFQEYIDKFKLKKSKSKLTSAINMNSGEYKIDSSPYNYTTRLTICDNIPLSEFDPYITRLGKFGYTCTMDSQRYPGNKKVIIIKIDKQSVSINESKSNDDTLYIFDFDDTLMLNRRFEEIAIEYLKEDVTIRSLLLSSIRKIGVKMSDLKWENGKIYVDDPNQMISIRSEWIRKGKRVYLTTPDKFYYTDMSLPVATTKLIDLYNSVENKAIVTGRHDDIKHKVSNSLKEFRLVDPNYGLHCYPGKRNTEQKIGEWKSTIIIDLIKKSECRNVYFYDDNSKWVNKATAAVKKEMPHINWIPIKYKHQNG